jgi:hypothetical protein
VLPALPLPRRECRLLMHFLVYRVNSDAFSEALMMQG